MQYAITPEELAAFEVTQRAILRITKDAVVIQKSPAAKYNYANERLYAITVAFAFLCSVTLCHMDSFKITAKDIKKRTEELNEEQKKELVLATPGWTDTDRKTCSYSQALMIVKDFEQKEK